VAYGPITGVRDSTVANGRVTGVGAPIHVSWTPHRKSGHSSASHEAHGHVTGMEASIRVSRTSHPSLDTLQPRTRLTDPSPEPRHSSTSYEAHGLITGALSLTYGSRSTYMIKNTP